MSVGHGAYALLLEADDNLVIYTYCCYDVNRPDYKHFMVAEDGELYIDRDAFAEPEIREKKVRTVSGKKRSVVRRITRDFSIHDLLESGKIRVNNASGTWRTIDNGQDFMALKILSLLFTDYQKKGKLPESVELYY